MLREREVMHEPKAYREVMGTKPQHTSKMLSSKERFGNIKVRIADPDLCWKAVVNHLVTAVEGMHAHVRKDGPKEAFKTEVPTRKIADSRNRATHKV